MDKAAFLNQVFVKPNHIPPTKLGYFDATYRPRTRQLKIEVRYQILFVNASMEWTDEMQEAFKPAFTARIPEFWDNKFEIRCTRPGWTDVVAVPEFTLVEGEDRHFAINAIGALGARNTSVRPYGTGHNQLPDTVDHATARFGLQAADRMANAGMQTRQIKEALRTPFDIPFGDPSGGGQLSFAAMSHLQSFADNVVHAFARTRVRPTIRLTAIDSRSAGAADRVKSVLHHFGIQNPITTRRDSIFGNKQASGVRVEWDNLATFDANFPEDPEAIPLMSQATVVHEYGHMLGLPDEYNLLCGQSVDPLVVYRLVREDAEGERFLDYNIARDAAQSDAISENQRQFMLLCGAAGLVPPPFGRANMNIMSGGSRFQPHHCVTVWNCLCQMTEEEIDPDEWQIRMLP